MVDFALARTNMVEGQIRPNDVTDRRIIAAMLEVPRERFVPEPMRPFAYVDEDLLVKRAEGALPARYLMEPMPFARLLQLAEIDPADLVLDLGCATGYSTAIIARLARAVVGIEEDDELARAAAANLASLGVANAEVVQAPLRQGRPQPEGFDAIIIEGSVEYVPDELCSQLREGGRLVVVVGQGRAARATLYGRTGGSISSREAFDCAVAPLPGFSKPPSFVF